MRSPTATLGVVLALAAPVTANAAAVEVPTTGGTVIVHDGRHQAVIADAVLRDPSPTPISDFQCPGGRVVVSVLTRAAMQAAVPGEEPNGAMLRGTGGPCRIVLDARIMNHLSPPQACSLVLHELGHARGWMGHTESGRMARELAVEPIAECAPVATAASAKRQAKRRAAGILSRMKRHWRR